MPKYVVCDLDDCLLKTDLLYEQFLVLLKTRPLRAFLTLFGLFRGRAYFKNQVAALTPMDAASLPFRLEVLQHLKDSKQSDNPQFILASASPQVWVSAVAKYLGIFDHVIASSVTENLKGPEKLKALRRLIQNEDFKYIGDHPADLALWQEADEIVAVNPSPNLRAEIEKLKKSTQYIFDPKKPLIRLLFQQLRPHQWIKNLLVFLPAFAGHKIFSIDIFLQGIGAFIGFSFAASFVYVLNDLLDLKADRAHHTKKNRPFAAGVLPIQWGVILLPTLFAGLVVTTLFLSPQFAGWIGIYLILNIAYSMYLKQSVVIDVLALSMMYTLRIFAGSAATAVPVSEWLLSFSTLFFFSLACVKRYTEIIRSKNKITLDGRGYRQVDDSMMQSLGVGSGLISVMIILLYLQSNEVRALYAHPQNLWFAIPVLLFWISRMWILTNRDEVNDDPVVFAVKDKASWLCLLVLAFIFGISG